MAVLQHRVVSDYTSFQPMFDPHDVSRWKVGENGLIQRDTRLAYEPGLSGHTDTVIEQAQRDLNTNPELSNAVLFEDWLPFAAKAYHINPDPNAYLFRPVLAILTDLPNRNGVGFPVSELVKWNPHRGRQAYQTWIGMPMHSEHGNWHPNPDDPDPKLAIGVIADVVMTALVGFGQNKLWKVVMLAAIDRTKDVARAKRIETGELNTYSMGAMVGGYTCSYCGKLVGKGCNHIDPDQPVVLYRIGDHLVYRLCYDVSGMELSSVGDPAYGVAASDIAHIRY